MARSTLQLNTYLGPYYLVKLIAIGGMAEIYMATSKGVGGYEKRLALKVIHPDYADDRRFVQMLVDEAKIAVKLNHPNIAQTFDLGRIGNCYFISMEFVDGADFFQVLKRTSEMGREFPVPASLLVAHEALRGLDHAHKKCDEDGQPLQIIHRDVSPQNMLISRQGEVKLVDFGIAKAANLSTKTRSGVIKGKLVYMSPEQSWGESVDQRSDVFSAGIVLYEALTGGSIYLEKNPVKLLEMVRKAAIPPPLQPARARGHARAGRPGDEGAAQQAGGPLRHGGRFRRRAGRLPGAGLPKLLRSGSGAGAVGGGGRIHRAPADPERPAAAGPCSQARGGRRPGGSRAGDAA